MKPEDIKRAASLRSRPVRLSNLKHIATSPLHYASSLIEEPSDTPARRMGKLVHSLLLGGTGYVVYNGERRGNAWKAFEAEHDGCEIVTAKEDEFAKRARDAVLSHDEAPELLEGEHEVPLEWTVMGRRCATRGVDVIGERWQTELKTCFTAAPWRFPHIALQQQYHVQLAWFREAVRQRRDRTVDASYVVVVEMKPPFAVTTWEVSERALHQGDRTWRLWMERLLACEALPDDVEWPGYVQTRQVLDVPDDDEFSVRVGGEDIGFEEGASP